MDLARIEARTWEWLRGRPMYGPLMIPFESERFRHLCLVKLVWEANGSDQGWEVVAFGKN